VGAIRITGTVGVVFVSGAQALRMKIPVMKNNKLKKDCFMGFSFGK